MTVTEAFSDVANRIAQVAPDKLVTLQASAPMSARVEELVSARKAGALTPEEATELDQFLALDLFISLAKARARLQ